MGPAHGTRDLHGKTVVASYLCALRHKGTLPNSLTGTRGTRTVILISPERHKLSGLTRQESLFTAERDGQKSKGAVALLVLQTHGHHARGTGKA